MRSSIAAVVIGVLLLALGIVWRRRRARLALAAGAAPESAVPNASTTLPATPEPAGALAPEVASTLSPTAPGAEPD